MRIEEKLTHGVFCHEIKNRFRCAVDVNGEDKVCYVASSSRLSNFITLVGKEVLLLPQGENANSTEYTLYAVKYRNSYILLELSLANAALAEQINRKYFSFLGKRKRVQREKVVSGYKADFFIEESRTLVEVKTVLSDQKEALFPTVYSERSIKQLKQINKLLNEGYRFCMLFAALSPTIKEINIDRDSEFYDAFMRCIEKGLMYRACSLKTTEHGITVRGFVEIKI